MQEQSRRFLRLPDVMRQVGYGRTTLLDAVKKGHFPKPYPLGARAVAWLSDDIDKWITSRIKAARVKS